MAYTPEQSPNLAAQRDAENRVKDLPRGNFMFAYHPDEWQLDGAGRLVPVIVHLSKEPGNGGVGSDGDFTLARVQYEKRGFTLVPHDILGGDQDYVALYRNRRGKKVHRTIFQQPYDTAGGGTEWAFDQEAWDAFIALLRKKGVIKQPRPKIVEGMRETLVQRRDQLLRREPSRDQADKHEAWEKKLALANLQLKTLAEEIEKSYVAYGRPTSVGRSRVMQLLEQAADETGDPDVDAVRRKALPGRVAAAKAAEDEDDEPERDDDEATPRKDVGKAAADTGRASGGKDVGKGGKAAATVKGEKSDKSEKAT